MSYQSSWRRWRFVVGGLAAVTVWASTTGAELGQSQSMESSFEMFDERSTAGSPASPGEAAGIRGGLINAGAAAAAEAADASADGRLDTAAAVWAEYLQLGRRLQGQGLPEDAEAAFGVALLLEPGAATTRMSLGELLLEQGRLVEAEAQFREAVALVPDDASYWARLGEVLFLQQGWREARVAYSAAVRLAPSEAGYRLMQRETTRRVAELTSARRSGGSGGRADVLGSWVVQGARWFTAGMLAIAGVALVFPLLGGAFLLVASPLERLRRRG